jgi:serine protease Do
VVNVASVQLPTAAEAAREPSPLPPEIVLDELFRDLLERQRRNRAVPRGSRRETLALGSGFIIDPTGLIVTNDHVVGDATRIRVTLHDGTTLPARLVGRDARMDLALLKIESRKPLRAVTWGRSDDVRIGDWVLTVGNPFGLVNSVAAGIVSGRNRDLHTGPYDEYIQTDAAMNTGNSGGPMFDLSGRVVGIDTAIYTQTGGSVGVGFAIPSNQAQPVIEQLKRSGRVARGFLGVNLQTVTDEVATVLQLDRPRGALVTQVVPEGPAAAAKLRRGDVILAVAGETAATVRQVQRLIAALPIDQPAGLVVWRDRRELPVEVRVGEQPEDRRTAGAGPPGSTTTPRDAVPELLGLTLGPVSPAERQSRALKPTTPAVAVMDVVPQSPADEAGLAAGDVILQFDGAAVASPEDAVQRLRDAVARRRLVLLLVDRVGDRRFVALRAGG